jgi:hypothetical protein
MAEWFIYIRSTDRVVGFDKNLLQRNDIVLINREQATRIIARSEERRRNQAEQAQSRMVKESIDRSTRGNGAELMGTEFERPAPQIVDAAQRDIGSFPDPESPLPVGVVQAVVADPNKDPDLHPSTVDLAAAIENLGG